MRSASSVNPRLVCHRPPVYWTLTWSVFAFCIFLIDSLRSASWENCSECSATGCEAWHGVTPLRTFGGMIGGMLEGRGGGGGGGFGGPLPAVLSAGCEEERPLLMYCEKRGAAVGARGTGTNTGPPAICPFLRASVGGHEKGNESPDTSGAGFYRKNRLQNTSKMTSPLPTHPPT